MMQGMISPVTKFDQESMDEVSMDSCSTCKVSDRKGVCTSCLSNIPLAALLNMLWTYVFHMFSALD